MLIFLVCIAIMLCCLILLFFALRSWWMGGSRPVPIVAHATEEVSLEDLSLVWTRPIKEKINCFADLPRYRQDKAPAKGPEPQRSRPVFRHEEIERFYREKVEGKPFFLKDIRECAEDILKLLDDVGECPSVVNKNTKEAEKRLKTDIYDLLKQVPLYLHSLNVAREITRHCKQQAVMPKAIIAALAHDLGKIPSYQDKAYSTGDHPHIAPMVLGTLESFNKLAFAEDIIDAVRCHHRPNPESDLAQRLKDADQDARTKELAPLLNAAGLKGEVENGKGKEEPLLDLIPEDREEQQPADKQKSVPAHLPVEEEQEDPGDEIDANEVIFGSGGEVDPDIFGSEERGEERIVNRKVEIGWFDPHAALDYIKPFINRMKGGRFAVFSMPDGYVYAEAFFFWKVAQKLSRGDTRLHLAEADIQARRNIMFSMVERLKKEANAIAGEFLGEGYFMARFVLNPESDKPKELCFIPFLAQAFGDPVSILEARKVARLREIVKVVPKHCLEKETTVFGSGKRPGRGG